MSLVSGRSLRMVVPITTALFGALGLSTGLYSFLSPDIESAKIFGIQPPGNLATSSEADSRQRAYIQIHGIRNFANGLGLVALTAFWRFSSTCQSSPSAAGAVQKGMAILMTAGSVVGLADGLVLSGYLNSIGLSDEARNLAKEKRTGHMVLALPVMGLALGWWNL